MDIVINSCKTEEMINITEKVKSIVKESLVNNGIMVLYVPHTSAAITITENTDFFVQEDILNTLDKLVPTNHTYKHIGGNSYAHIKSCLVGQSQTFIIENGELRLGKWQDIFFCEFDGPRKRNIYVSIK